MTERRKNITEKDIHAEPARHLEVHGEPEGALAQLRRPRLEVPLRDPGVRAGPRVDHAERGLREQDERRDLADCEGRGGAKDDGHGFQEGGEEQHHRSAERAEDKPLPRREKRGGCSEQGVRLTRGGSIEGRVAFPVGRP